MWARRHRETIDELYKPIRINFPRRRTEIRSIKDTLQMDLADFVLLARHNDNHRYVLLCVNPFTKKFYSARLKTKSAREVCDAAKRIIQESGIQFEKIFTDKGTEFKNAIFRREIERALNIRHFYSTGIKKVLSFIKNISHFNLLSTNSVPLSREA